MEKYKILIVEDILITAWKIQSNLEKLGYEITDCVQNTNDAIDSIIKNTPDIVILDYFLPRNTKGAKVAEYIEQHFSPLIPIIYITGQMKAITPQEITKTNHDFSFFLEKPFTENQLHINIRQAISLSEKFKKPQKKYFLPIKINGNQEFLQVNKILWINTETKTHGTFITTEEREHEYKTYMSVTKIDQINKCPYLVKINQSYIINLNKVARIENKQVFFINKEIPKTIWNRKKSGFNYIRNNRKDDWDFTLGKTYRKQKDAIYNLWLKQQNLL